MSFVSYQLYDLNERIGRDDLRRILADFSCPKDMDVERFLKENALKYEDHGITRTYILCYRDDETEKDTLIAYYSLTIKEIEFSSEVPRCTRVKVLGTPDGSKKKISVLLIAQLGRNHSEKSCSVPKLPGDMILTEAMKRCAEIHDQIGGRMLILECKDIPFLHRLYQDKGFMKIMINRDLSYRQDQELHCYAIDLNKIEHS